MQNNHTMSFRSGGIVLLVTAVALATRWLLDPVLDGRLPFVTFFIGIATIVYLAGTRAALLGMAFGGLLALRFFIPPDNSMTVTTVVDAVGMAMYFSVGLSIIAFGHAATVGQRRARDANARSREQMELLRQTLVSIGDGVIATDTQGKVTLINAVAERLTGWSSDAAHGKPLTEVFRVVNEETRAEIRNPVETVLECGEIVGLANHTMLISRDDHEYLIADSAAPISDGGGSVIGVVLVFRDVTEQRAIDKKLAESEGRKTAMLESALDAVVCIDDNGNIVEFNSTAERIFGHRADDAIGREMAELVIPPEARDSHRHGLAKYLRTGEQNVLNRLVELTAINADGHRFPVEVSISAIEHRGRPAFVGYIRDISEAKRDETARRESEERFRALTMATASIVWNTNADGEFDFEQASWSEYTGQSFKEHAGQGWLHALHPDDRASVKRTWESALASRRPYRSSGRLWHAKSNAYRYFEAHAVPLLNTDGNVREWVGLCRDVEREKRMEVQLQQSVSGLTEANRRKNEFLAILAHELRNPLTPICNALEIITVADTDNEIIADASAMMQRQLAQMVRLVDDLLDMSRIDRGVLELRRELVELSSIIDHAVEAARPLSDSMTQDLSVTLPAEPVYVNADTNRLTQAIGNLLSNAVKYSMRGDDIRLIVTLEQDDVVIRVQDDGIGIDSRHLSRIFDLFSQIDSSPERANSGLGIGLTLAKRIVELHDGEITAYSRGTGKGSEFVVRLPTLPEHLAPDAIDKRVEVSDATRTFLIVDDNRDSADSLAMLLRHSGNQTHTAYDGNEALASAADLRPDIIVLDIGMPGRNGYDVAREIRQQEWGKHKVLVALTGWGQEEDVRRAEDAGFDAHFIKPLDMDAFADFLAQLDEHAEAGPRSADRRKHDGVDRTH